MSELRELYKWFEIIMHKWRDGYGDWDNWNSYVIQYELRDTLRVLKLWGEWIKIMIMWMEKEGRENRGTDGEETWVKEEVQMGWETGMRYRWVERHEWKKRGTDGWRHGWMRRGTDGWRDMGEWGEVQMGGEMGEWGEVQMGRETWVKEERYRWVDIHGWKRRGTDGWRDGWKRKEVKMAGDTWGKWGEVQMGGETSERREVQMGCRFSA